MSSAEIFLGAARIFASHYQLVICDEPLHQISDLENWTDEKVALGFAGAPRFRMVGTAADLNDHWVELVLAAEPPDPDAWQRITCVDFVTISGDVHVMSVIDAEPTISTRIEPGEYAAFFAAQNIGIDQLSLGEISDGAVPALSDEALASRKDVEWYRIFLVRGRPARTGRIVDRT